jgi:hypothetical protein
MFPEVLMFGSEVPVELDGIFDGDGSGSFRALNVP